VVSIDQLHSRKPVVPLYELGNNVLHARVVGEELNLTRKIEQQIHVRVVWRGCRVSLWRCRRRLKLVRFDITLNLVHYELNLFLHVLHGPEQASIRPETVLVLDSGERDQFRYHIENTGVREGIGIVGWIEVDDQCSPTNLG